MFKNVTLGFQNMYVEITPRKSMHPVKLKLNYILHKLSDDWWVEQVKKIKIKI